MTVQQFRMADGQVHQFKMPSGLSVAEMTRLATESYNQAKEQEFAQARETQSPENNPRSTLGVMKQSAIKGVTGMVDLASQMTPYEMLKRGISSGSEALQGNYGQAIMKGLPQQPLTQSLIHSNVLKPEYEPNNPMLKAIDFTTQMATGGGINPATIARNTLPQLGRFALQSGVGTGTQQFLESAGVNPIGQAVGTALTMGVAGIPTAIRSTTGDVARNALKNVTPEQIKLAQMLMNDAQRLGTPLTAAEALAQVTGGNRLTSTQRIVENAPKSAQIMADFMNQRPNANVNAFNQTANQVSTYTTRPTTLNQTATNFIERSEKGLNKGTEPLYAKAELEIRPSETEIKNLISNPKIGPSIKNAINHVISDPNSGATGLKPTDSVTLMAAKKYLDELYVNLANPAKEGFSSTKSGFVSLASRELNDFLRSKSPSYAKANDIQSSAISNVIKPRKEGMLGQLADTSGTTESMMGSQRGILMPPAPMATSPEDIKLVIKLLRRQDPDVVKDWTRQNLQSIFNENSQNLQSGANQFGGAKFAASIAGNTNQRENLKTLVSQGSSPQAWKGFETLLDVFQAQGKRLPAGSATAFNKAELDVLSGGGNVAKLAITPTKPSKIMDVFEEFRLGQNTQKLAELLTDPDGIKKLEALSKTKPNSAKREVLTNSIAGGLIGGKEPIEENQP